MLNEYLGLCRQLLSAGSPLKVFMRRTYLFVFYLLIFSALFGLPGKATCQRATVVRVSPAEVTLLPGESQTVEILVDDVGGLYGFALEISFDPAALTVPDSSLEQGGFLSTDQNIIFINQVDNDRGLIEFVMTQKRDPITDPFPLPRDGSGALIRFQILAKNHPGESNLNASHVLLSDRDGVEIPAEKEDGVVHITSEGDQFFVYLPLISY